MITLGKTPERILEIRRPDGRLLKLTVKKRTLIQLKENEKKLNQLQGDLSNKKIDSVDFLSGTFELLVDNYNFDDFADLELDHVLLIIEELKKLQIEKPEEEKKNQ